MGARCSARCGLPNSCCPSALEVEEITTIGFVESLSVLDWGPGNEPVGQVFEDTLDCLGTIDRNLFLFCATPNVAAVKWLFHLGASVDNCDTNGTTCLHAACRCGTLAVVSEIMQRALLLDASDIAMWTPLHIASHMGRREVVSRLLKAKANPRWRNVRGQTPTDLCKDQGTIEVLKAAIEQGAALPSDDIVGDLLPTGILAGKDGGGSTNFGLGAEDSVGIPSFCEPECYFVNPGPVIRGTGPYKKQLVQIACIIFNVRPSHGLAFAVVSNLVDSYTSAMRVFMQRPGVSKATLGDFLGEAFSLCQLIRFSIFDSIPLLHTGVLSALTRVCRLVQLPQDLLKMDRVVRSLAHVWWRKHKTHAEGLSDPPTLNIGEESDVRVWRSPSKNGGVYAGCGCEEYEGIELYHYLAGSEALYQLMLSTVMLHWYLHGNKYHKGGLELSFSQWGNINRGIESDGGSDVPDHVQRRIHSLVSARFLPELALSELKTPICPQTSSLPRFPRTNDTAPFPHGTGSCSLRTNDTAPFLHGTDSSSHRKNHLPAPRSSLEIEPLRASQSALSCCATAEGWVTLMGGTLPCTELTSRDAHCERTGMPNLGQPFCLSEVFTANVASSSIDANRDEAVEAKFSLKCGEVDENGDLLVWASLCSVFLFFCLAESQDARGVPYAMIDARDLLAISDPTDDRIISLRGSAAENGSNTFTVTLLVLLSDGRWQEVRLPKVDLKVSNVDEKAVWMNVLQRWQPPPFASTEL